MPARLVYPLVALLVSSLEVVALPQMRNSLELDTLSVLRDTPPIRSWTAVPTAHITSSRPSTCTTGKGTTTTSNSKSNTTLNTRITTSTSLSCTSSPPEETGKTRFCYPWSDPTRDITNICQCNDGGKYSADSGCDPCPWTTTPPASMTYHTATGTEEGRRVTFTSNPKCRSDHIADSECWNSLGTTVALQQFWDANEKSCNERGFKDFANCWGYVKLNNTIGNCGSITRGSSCTEPAWSLFTHSETPELDYYITYAIWNSNRFFENLWDAIGSASGSVGLQVGKLVDQLSPSAKNLDGKYFMMAIAFALSLYAEGRAATKALLRVPGQTTTVLIALLYPAGTGEINGQIEAWVNLESDLGSLADEWQHKVVDANFGLFDELGTFLTWCNHDFFCTGEGADLPELTAKVKLALGTYIGSQAIISQNLIVTRSEGLDVAKLQEESWNDLRWDPGCPSYNEYGSCENFVFDGTDTYSIADPGNFVGNNYTTLWEVLFSGSNPMTTPELLLTGAYTCGQECDTTTEDCAPTLGSDIDDFTPTCLSTAKVCTWSWDDVGPWKEETGSCKQTDLDTKNNKYREGPCKAFKDNSHRVPTAYLGGGIMK